MKNFILLAALGFILNFTTPAHAMFFTNGDFETGSLSGWFVQEDFTDVASSPLVLNVDDGTGNHVGEINAGFTSDGILTTTLGRDIGTLPVNAQNLFFDFFLFDAGADPQGSGNVPDTLTISLLTGSGDLAPLLTATTSGNTIGNPGLTQVSLLSNGFFHVQTDISGFQGGTNSKLFFDLLDDDDQRLNKAWIDNLDLTFSPDGGSNAVPEPASFLLLGIGLLASLRLRREKTA